MKIQFRLPILATILLTAFGVGIHALSSTAAEPAATAKSVLTVHATQPVARELDRSLPASGGLFAWQESVVSAELGGLAITELNVDVGSVVKRGQVLARLSQDAVRAGLAAQQANVAKARAALAEAAANAGRARLVQGSGALSEQQVQQYLLAEESARAGLAAAEAAANAEEVRLRQTAILAPDGGVISARNATLGAVVQPGIELFRLVRQGRIEWRAELTAEQLAQVRVGQKARIRLSDGRTVEGSVRMLSPTIDGNSRKALAYVDLISGNGTGSPARAGMFGQGEILFGKNTALTVPHAAVVLRDGNAYLFEIDANDHILQRKVQIGRHSGDAVEVLGGISETARIVASGGAFLNSGDHVRVLAPGADPASAGAGAASK